MKNDYLWDGSGEPDPELQRLERVLGEFRTTAPLAAMLWEASAPQTAAGKLLNWRWPRMAAVTVLTAGIALVAVLAFVRVTRTLSGPGWEVASLEGSPTVGTSSGAREDSELRLRVGDLLVTDAGSRASVQVAGIGELYVDPGSRVRLLETDANRKRIALEVGTIHAAIWAPPGEFVVDTPSATAVDLGCAYTLKVAEDGSGSLRTTLGWVGFHHNGRDSFIPAGAMCLTHRKEGPGTPFFEDSNEVLRAALQSLDFEELSGPERKEALQTALRQARPRDAFTLWHLLSRVSSKERPLVYDRLAALVAPPAGTTRDGTLRLDRKMMDLWWNAFDLGDIGVWRFWEQHEAPRTQRSAG